MKILGFKKILKSKTEDFALQRDDFDYPPEPARRPSNGIYMFVYFPRHRAISGTKYHDVPTHRA